MMKSLAFNFFLRVALATFGHFFKLSCSFFVVVEVFCGSINI